MRIRILFVSIAMVIGLLLSACTPAAAPTSQPTSAATSTLNSPTAAPTQTAQTGASIAQALPNAAYPIEGTSTGKAQLKDGVFEEPAAPGSAAKIKVSLDKVQAFGDVNGDGTEDAALTLEINSGGSGTFSYLALVINDKGTAKSVSSIFLGDRIIVESLAIKPGSVVVTMLTRKPEEPMVAEPKIELTRTFNLQGDQLVEVK